MAAKNSNPNGGVRSKKGIALIIALFAMIMMVFIAEEVSRDATVEYVISSQAVNRVRAYYAAKAGIEISLLRLMVYKQAVAAMGQENAAMLEPIWQFPFMWPPIAAGTEVDKSIIQDAVSESLMTEQYTTQITSEGGRIDINDVGSPVKALSEATKKLILKIFQDQLQTDREFQKKYGNEKFEELVNNIADWVDEDKESQNGGEESRPYQDLEDASKFPPNRAFRTVEELHMVGGMKDDFYRLLEPRITVYGTMGISINYAPKEVLMSLDATMTDEVVTELINIRSDPKRGPFKTADEFLSEAARLGANTRNIEALKIPLLTGIEYNFRIKSTGISNNIGRTLTAVTYDFDNLAKQLAKSLDEQAKKDNPPDDKTPPKEDPKDDQKQSSDYIGPKGRPTVVLWQEN